MSMKLMLNLDYCVNKRLFFHVSKSMSVQSHGTQNRVTAHFWGEFSGNSCFLEHAHKEPGR